MNNRNQDCRLQPWLTASKLILSAAWRLAQSHGLIVVLSRDWKAQNAPSSCLLMNFCAFSPIFLLMVVWAAGLITISNPLDYSLGGPALSHSLVASYINEQASTFLVNILQEYPTSDKNLCGQSAVWTCGIFPQVHAGTIHPTHPKVLRWNNRANISYFQWVHPVSRYFPLASHHC